MSRNRLLLAGWLGLGLYGWLTFQDRVLAANPLSNQLATAEAAVAKLDLEATLQAYRAAPQAAPTSHEATWKLCRALVDKATLSNDNTLKKPLLIEAETLARQAVNLQPNNAKGQVYLAICLGQRALLEGGKRKVELSKEVRRAATQALALNPQEDLAHHTLAIWHREMAQLNWFLRKFAETLYGKFPAASLAEATTHLEQAVALAPGSVAHRVELALTYLAAGQQAKALEQFERAERLPNSWFTDPHYRLLAQRHRSRASN